jgi:hypothetical protein
MIVNLVKSLAVIPSYSGLNELIASNIAFYFSSSYFDLSKLMPNLAESI